MQRERIRMRFRKEGDLRLISHRDLLCALQRLFRRVGVKLSMSEGFHPRPRISFPISLALGVRGIDEIFEVELDDPPDAAAVLADFQAQAPAGLVFTHAETLPPGTPKLAVAAADYRIDVPADRQAEIAARVAEFLASATHVIQRDHRDQTVDVRASVVALSIEGDALRMRLATSNSVAAAKPQDVLAAIGAADLLDDGGFFTREKLVLAEA